MTLARRRRPLVVPSCDLVAWRGTGVGGWGGGQLCVANRAVRVLGAGDWPERGECFRGAALPAAHAGFYAAGTKYRVPGFLATSFSEDVARDFARRAFHAGEGEHPAVLYTVLVRPSRPARTHARTHALARTHTHACVHAYVPARAHTHVFAL